MANRTTEDIIILAYRQTSIISANEIPSAVQMSDGFNLLNDLISLFNSSELYIPYQSIINFNMVGGQNRYIFSQQPQMPSPPGPPSIVSNPIIELDFVNLIFGTVIYPVRIISKAEFYNNIRVVGLPGIPVFCFLSSQNVQGNASIVEFYPYPSQAFAIEMKCKVVLNYLTRFTNATDLPPFYFRFLRYSLARELMSFYPSTNWSATDEKEYLDMKEKMTAADEWNLAVKTDKTLNFGGPYYTYAVNGMLIV